jgi:hypothetical protein
MTSAPDQVPEDCRGTWVLNKKRFWDNPTVLLPLVLRVLAA